VQNPKWKCHTVATDKINPTDPIDMARGLTTGIASPESK
jgi:hypothetical protein